MNQKFKHVTPVSQQDAYSPLANPKFNIKIGQGYEKVRNSVCVSGLLKVTRNGNPLAIGDEIFYDKYAGAHNLLQNVYCRIPQYGTEEHLTEYSRIVKMDMICKTNVDEIVGSSVQNIELKCGHDQQSRPIMIGNAGVCPFNFKLANCINRTNRNINGKEAPLIELGFTLKSPSEAFYGNDNLPANNISYTIENLKISYIYQPQSSASQGPLEMVVLSDKEYTVNSKVSYTELFLPIPTRSLSCSMVTQANYVNNSMQIDNPDVNELKFLFNDENGYLISYQLDDTSEILMNYKLSMGSQSDVDSLRPSLLNETFGFGINFMNLLPPKTKVSLQLDSNNPSNLQPYKLFNIYRGVVEVK